MRARESPGVAVTHSSEGRQQVEDDSYLTRRSWSGTSMARVAAVVTDTTTVYSVAAEEAKTFVDSARLVAVEGGD